MEDFDKAVEEERDTERVMGTKYINLYSSAICSSLQPCTFTSWLSLSGIFWGVFMGWIPGTIAASHGTYLYHLHSYHDGNFV